MLDSFRLDDRVALVTGSATGLGQAMAIGLAEAGANIVCHGNVGEDLDDTTQALTKLGRQTLALAGDLSVRETPRELIEKTIARFGQLDILINNAGMIRRAPATEYSEEDWTTVIEVNLNSVFRMSQLAGRHMIERGRGKILNVASLLAFQGGVIVPAYAASKGGVAQLTKALANEWAAKGVNVNAIAPGYMRTNNTRALQQDETRSRQILERIPAGRWGEPSDLAGAAVYLCSAASDYVNGHVLLVDGGWMAR